MVFLWKLKQKRGRGWGGCGVGTGKGTGKSMRTRLSKLPFRQTTGLLPFSFSPANGHPALKFQFVLGIGLFYLRSGLSYLRLVFVA